VAAVLLAVGLAGCTGDDGTEPSAQQVVEGDGVTVTVSPGPNSVLTAVVEVEADHPVRPGLVAVDGEHRVEVPAPERAERTVELALVGLRAQGAYELTLTGIEGVDPVTFRTGELPDDLPAVEATVNGEPRPGATLFNVTPDDLSVEHPGNLVAVDHEGHVVWYLQDSQMISDVRQLPGGDVLYNFGNIGARRVDVLGRLVHDWTTETRVRVGRRDRFGHETYADGATVLGVPRLHHEVSAPLPDGNYLALSQEIRTFRGFDDPGCPPDEPFPDPTVRPQRGDVVVEYAPDGRIVHRVSLFDGIDPREQPGSQQCNVKTDQIGTLSNDPFVDWSHANSATLFEDENVVLVSARNLSSVMALRWEDDADGSAGEVLWQLGPGLDFRLTEGEWFYRQHAPELQPDGTILLYDNGSQRPLPDDGDDKAAPYSRAVQYELDRSGPRGTWTARQVWEHRIETEDGPIFADFLGDADDLGDDHVLITHGAVLDREVDHLYPLVVEVDRRTDEVLLSIRVPSVDGLGHQTYRAEHVDTWYPRGGVDDLAGDPPLP
jgi:hypothetical protein